jgi:hypothetical protein
MSKTEEQAEKKVEMLSAGLKRVTGELVKSDPWTTLDFTARLDQGQAEALPAAIRDLYVKTLQDAGPAVPTPTQASEVVRGVECEKVAVKGFCICEGQEGAVVLEREAAVISNVRLRKQERKDGEVTVWLYFSVAVQGREAGVWGSMHYGDLWRVKLR